ncbi:MAG: hypothetical protein A3C50_01670 [Candidatus Staskawiczbacteria bacterium RIFCSPHIGHO2_02_FULL_43_16]|nr:MAG: hypothetical protein A3C50_01670 [Candidatus Staskawiczbacteria bacterium RIFCSPHIGHO2_02_FULL_43_16]OGZ74486.1 MAG: hypothetical protein A3A12_01825 [Candidatus Staskawiczbacteria bacterium RIFCSPLOWO2_01_FULL_43_17b]
MFKFRSGIPLKDDAVNFASANRLRARALVRAAPFAYYRSSLGRKPRPGGDHAFLPARCTFGAIPSLHADPKSFFGSASSFSQSFVL